MRINPAGARRVRRGALAAGKWERASVLLRVISRRRRRPGTGGLGRARGTAKSHWQLTSSLTACALGALPLHKSRNSRSFINDGRSSTLKTRMIP